VLYIFFKEIISVKYDFLSTVDNLPARLLSIQQESIYALQVELSNFPRVHGEGQGQWQLACFIVDFHALSLFYDHFIAPIHGGMGGGGTTISMYRQENYI
jgi:hypothetical protein